MKHIITLLVSLSLLILVACEPTSPRDRGYKLGLKAGTDCVASGFEGGSTNGVNIYMLRDNIQNESEEVKQGYRQGFEKGYWDNIGKLK